MLAGVALPLARNKVKRDKEEILRYDLREMRDAIDRYKDAADQGKIKGRRGYRGLSSGSRQPGKADASSPARPTNAFVSCAKSRLIR